MLVYRYMYDVLVGNSFVRKGIYLGLFVMLALLFLLGTTAQAKLKFEQTIIEEVVSFDAISHPFSFNFTNESEGDVRVSGVEVSCGCVELEEVLGFYGAGDLGAIRGIVDLTRMVGKLDAQIFIDIQGDQNRQLTMNLKLMESKHYSFSPQFLEWDYQDDVMPRYIRLEAVGLGAKLDLIEPDNGQFDVQIVEQSLNAKAIILKVTPVSTQRRLVVLFQAVVTVSGEPVETYNFRFAIK